MYWSVLLIEIVPFWSHAAGVSSAAISSQQAGAAHATAVSPVAEEAESYNRPVIWVEALRVQTIRSVRQRFRTTVDFAAVDFAPRD